MKYISLYIALILVVLTLSSCGKNDDKPNCHRTVLVYVAANNNLSGYDAYDLTEMRRAVQEGALNGGRLILFRVNKSESPALYEMDKTGELQLLKQYESTFLSTDPDNFRIVCDDMRRFAPNNQYGLVLWSHASGWLSHSPSTIEVADGPQYSWGSDRSYQMTMPQLRQALDGQNFSFIYFDCCFMGNVESLYEIRHAAPFFVASPTELLAYGMPYQYNLECFFAKGDADLVQAAKNTFNYYNSMTGADRSCTMSVYNSAALENIADVARQILEHNSVVPEGMNYQQYGFNTLYAYFNGYFFDMYQYLSSLCADSPSLKLQLDAVWDQLIVYENHTEYFWGRYPLDNAHGLSCFIYPGHAALGNKYGYNYLQWFTDVVEPAITQ